MTGMYNRYVPQPDGSYRRNRVAEQNRPKPAPKPEPAPCPPPPPAQEHRPPPKQSCSHRQESGGFLRQLLPKDFDTGDLIVMLLLLLMAGDCQEDRNNALLTIALYFMM